MKSLSTIDYTLLTMIVLATLLVLALGIFVPGVL